MTEQQTTRHHEHHEEHARRCHPGSRRPGARKSAKVHLVKWAPNNLCPPHSHCVRSGQCPDICPGTACADTVAVLTSAHSAVLTPPWPTIAMRMPVQFTVVFVSHFLYVQPPVLRVTYVPPFLPPRPLGRGPVRLRRSERISCRRGCACPAPLARPACRRARSFRGRHMRSKRAGKGY